MGQVYDCGANHNKKDKKTEFWYSLAAGLSGGINVGYGIKTVLDGNEVREYYTEDRAKYTEPGEGAEIMPSDVWGMGIAALGATLMWRNRKALRRGLAKVASVPAKMYGFYRSCVDEVEQDRIRQQEQPMRRNNFREGY